MTYSKPSVTVLGDVVVTVQTEEPKIGNSVEIDDGRPLYTLSPAYDMDE